MKKKCGARHVVLARRICSDPAGELDHGLTAFGRWVRHANPGAILVLLTCLKYSLRKPIAEIQPCEVDFIGRFDRAGVGEITGRSDVERDRCCVGR